MNSIAWVIAAIVINAVIAAVAKKAQANAEAARRAKSASGALGSDAGARAGSNAGSNTGIDARNPPTEAMRGDGAMSAPSRASFPPTSPPSSGESVTIVRTPRSPKVIARGAAKSGAAPGGKPGSTAGSKAKPGSASALRPVARPSAPMAPPDAPRGGDSSDAMQSRQRLADAVAKVKAAESRIAAAQTGHDVRTHEGRKAAASTPKPAPAPAHARPAGQLTGRDLAAAMRNPADLRKAMLIGEILGRPRAERPI
ncbi:MAG: hypothetical protein ACOYMM_14195 [Phycisphaerales bacterium]